MKQMNPDYQRLFQMLYQHIFRHRVILLTFFILAAIITVTHGSSADGGDGYNEPPAKVIIESAEAGSNGTTVTWLESQPGTSPVAGYDIFRSRDGGASSKVGRVENGTTDFLDPDGQAGDVYTLIAFDNQTPAMTSALSDGQAAVAEQGGIKVVADTTGDQVGGVVPDGSHADEVGTPTQDPSAISEALDRHIAELSNQLNTAVDHDGDAAAHSILNGLYDNQKQMLRLYPTMSPDQRRAAEATCTAQDSTLDADVHLLSEKNFFEGLLAMAGCEALRTVGE